MIAEKDTIKCEAVFNEDRTHRFLWKQVWDKDKPLACVVTLNPCLSDNIVTDTTTWLVVNNVARLEEYGGVAIVNLFSLLTNKLVLRWLDDHQINHQDNDNYIVKTAQEAGVVILAWGKAWDTNQRIYQRGEEVVALLDSYKEKLRVLGDGERVGLHPLTPAIRGRWDLEPIDHWLEKSRTLAKERANKTEVPAESIPSKEE